MMTKGILIIFQDYLRFLLPLGHFRNYKTYYWKTLTWISVWPLFMRTRRNQKIDRDLKPLSHTVTITNKGLEGVFGPTPPPKRWPLH